MYNAIEIARSVTYWTNLGAKLPEDLTKAIELYEGILYTEVGHTPTVVLDKVTVANAEGVIRDLAHQIAIATTPVGMPGPQGHGPLERAKKQVLDAAARNVIHQGRLAVPDVIDKLTPRFDRRAEAYVAAVALLPEDITSDTLLAAGPEAVASYQDAQREAQYLNTISSWVFQAGSLFGLTKEAYPAIRILRPVTLLELIKLEEAQWKPAVNPTLQALDPVLVAAARLGVEFGVNTMLECASMKQRLESELKRPNAISFS